MRKWIKTPLHNDLPVRWWGPSRSIHLECYHEREKMREAETHRVLGWDRSPCRARLIAPAWWTIIIGTSLKLLLESCSAICRFIRLVYFSCNLQSGGGGTFNPRLQSSPSMIIILLWYYYFILPRSGLFFQAAHRTRYKFCFTLISYICVHYVWTHRSQSDYWERY